MEVASARAPASTVSTPANTSPPLPAAPAAPIDDAISRGEALERAAQGWALSATLARAVEARATQRATKAPAAVKVLLLDGVAVGSVLSATGGGSGPASTVDVEPITITCGAMAPAFYGWLSSSLRKQYNRRDGAIVTTDQRGRELERLEFYDALIVETTLPTLDKTAKKTGWMTVKIQPERSRSSPGSSVKPGGSKARAPKKPKGLSSSFRLVIDGVDGPERATRLESFTIRHGIKKLYIGEGRFPQIEPTKLDFPNLVLTVPLAYADELLQWYREYVIGGRSGPGAQKTGVLEILAGDGKTMLFSLNLYEVGIQQASIRSGAAGGAGKALTVELYVGRMELGGPGLGLD